MKCFTQFPFVSLHSPSESSNILGSHTQSSEWHDFISLANGSGHSLLFPPPFPTFEVEIFSISVRELIPWSDYSSWHTFNCPRVFLRESVSLEYLSTKLSAPSITSQIHLERFNNFFCKHNGRTINVTTRDRARLRSHKTFSITMRAQMFKHKKKISFNEETLWHVLRTPPLISFLSNSSK